MGWVLLSSGICRMLGTWKVTGWVGPLSVLRGIISAGCMRVWISARRMRDRLSECIAYNFSKRGQTSRLTLALATGITIISSRISRHDRI